MDDPDQQSLFAMTAASTDLTDERVTKEQRRQSYRPSSESRLPEVLAGYKGLSINAFVRRELIRSRSFQVKRNLLDIGKPVDRTRWASRRLRSTHHIQHHNEITFSGWDTAAAVFNF